MAACTGMVDDIMPMNVHSPSKELKQRYSTSHKTEIDHAVRNSNYVTSVPCGKCHLCCFEQVVLMPGHDNPANYDCVRTDIGTMVLRQKPNGECVYLTDGKCSIHGRQPTACRSFDCRRMYEAFSKLRLHARKELMKASPDSLPVIERGKQLLLETADG